MTNGLQPRRYRLEHDVVRPAGLSEAPVVALKIRLDPTDADARLFAVWAAASRRAWNWALEWERQHLDRVSG